MAEGVVFSVFTKPWPNKSIAELGRMVHLMGFDGIELPVRPGFPVHPENAAEELPRAVRALAEHNVKICSVAGPANERVIAACGAAGVPTLRVMVAIGGDGYEAAEQRTRREFDLLLPLLERYRVRIGVQNHFGRYVCNAAGLRALIGEYDPKYVGAVWDAAHNALQGEEPELAIEIVWPHLCMVNLKNAVWGRKNAVDAAVPEWAPTWTAGRDGLASWPRVASELKRRRYSGVICLTAEYSDDAQVDRSIVEDLNFAGFLFS